MGMKNKLIVLGGGPAGMLAAYFAARGGADVTLLEKNEKVLKKLFISGKGRCNITNACDVADFFRGLIRGGKFLYSAINSFTNEDIVKLLNENGLATKVERGGRVFPVSDKSSDVIKTLLKMATGAGVKIVCGFEAASVEKDGELFKASSKDGRVYTAGALLIATGGLSYRATGSTGDGYGWAERLGHNVLRQFPALVPLEDAHGVCRRMQGLALKNVMCTLYQNGKKVYSSQGEMLFTHFGLSGPEILSASSYINFEKGFDDVFVEIDLKPALSEEVLNSRLLREIDAGKNKQLKTIMTELLPGKMIHPFLDEIKMDANTEGNSITKEQRKKLVGSLKGFRIKIAGARPIDEAIITAGGVDVREINPKTMESKLVPGLYFAGEVLDISAVTGGYNLQIAFSTGAACGRAVATRE